MTVQAYDDKIEPLVFDENTNPNWQSQPGWNELFLESRMNYLQDLLRTQGYLFVNTAFEQFGFKLIPAGQRLGWFRGEDVFHYSISNFDDHYKITFWGYRVIWDKI